MPLFTQPCKGAPCRQHALGRPHGRHALGRPKVHVGVDVVGVDTPLAGQASQLPGLISMKV